MKIYCLGFELLGDKGREAGGVAGSGIALVDPMGPGLVQGLDGGDEVRLGFFRGLGIADGLHGSADAVFLGGIANGTVLGTADILNR